MTKTIFTPLALMLLALSSCEHALDPTWVGYHNKILFSSRRNGKEQLYIVNPDGSGLQQLTHGEFGHTNGRWSPDGTRIVCNTEEFTTTAGSEMVVMDVDGKNRRHLGPGSQMSWSPDGKKILFTDCESCELGVFDAALYSVDSNGLNRSLVSRDFAGEAAISPDGSTIAFVYVSPSDSIPQPIIKLMDYPSFINIRTIGPVGALAPSWSPGGKEIAFNMKPDGRTFYDIFIMDITGYAIQRVTNHQSSEHFYFPRWSPHGDRIAFISYLTDGSARSYLYVVNRDGSNLRRLLDDETVRSCDWSW